jgi:HSP20 family protein
MTIIRRNPRRDMLSLSRAFDQLFDDAAFRPLAWGGTIESRLPLDISSTEDEITVEAALPGIHPEDVDVTIHQDTLTIGVKEQAERETKEGERVYRELRRSSGSRTLTLPNGLDTDNATATFENGMLRLSIPRAEAAKPRQIPVSTVTDAPVKVAAQTGATEAQAGAEQVDQA